MVLGRTDSTVRELNLLFKENQIEKNVCHTVSSINLVPGPVEA